MDHLKRFFVFATVAAGLLCLSGCNTGDSNVGAVTGTLTVDGEAIADALVTFCLLYTSPSPRDRG